MDFIIILMVLNMRENGWKINNMEKARKLGQTVLGIQECIIWEEKMDKGNFYGQTDLPMKANLKIIIFMVMELIYGLTEENLQEIGNKIKWMVKGNFYGQMAENIKDNIWMIKKMELGNLSGLMVENTMDNGQMENNTEQAFTLDKMDRKEKENGTTAKELDGQTQKTEIKL